ncbi:MBL fold metallo-hydrolase [Candidatus Bathyarchaeota archaeon]|nr:MBL fold metallo-hydrolase [Candidatus Bathyarchaeota archaeon]
MSTSVVSDDMTMIDSPINGRTGVLGTYLVRGKKDTVIDPGPASQVPGVIDALDRLGVTELSTIALTHIHLDHAAGCWMLLERYPDAVIHCHPRGVEHMVDPSKIKAAARQAFGDKILEYGEIRGVPRGKLKVSVDGERLYLGGVELQVIWTPGHCSHSHSYFEPKGKVLFVGDTAGHTPENLGAVIPASPPPFNSAQTVESLNRLEALSPRTLCISHFGFHQNATQRLKGFRAQVMLWERLAAKGVEEGKRLPEIYHMVLEEDPEVQVLVSAKPDAERHVYSSLAGFVSYARWKRKG